MMFFYRQERKIYLMSRRKVSTRGGSNGGLQKSHKRDYPWGMSEQLAFVIKELERRKGSWPRLAVEAGVSKRTFEKIVSGNTRNPRIDTVEKLASYFRGQRA